MKKRVSAFALLIVFTLIFSIINIQGAFCEELLTISLKDSNITVPTKGESASVVIQKTGYTTGSVTVYYRTINGSALAETHYTPKKGSITFNSSETSKTISINTVDFDTWEKENRFFYVEIYKVEGNAIIDNDKDISKIIINHKDTISQSLVGNTHGNIFNSVWASAPYLSAQYDTGAVEKNSGEPKSDVGYLNLSSNTTYQYFIQNEQLNYFGQIISKIVNEGIDDQVKVMMYKNDVVYKSDGFHEEHDFRGDSIYFNESDMKSVYSIKYRYETNARGWGDDDAHVYYRFIHWLYDDNKPTLESFHVVGNTSEPYSDGDELYISAKFNEIVTVSSGIPQLPIKFSDNSILNANYIDGSGTDTLVFKLSIPNGKISSGLYIYNPSNNDSFIGKEYVKDLANNTMNAYSNTSCISTSIIIENTIPTINSIEANKSNVSLNESDDVTITLNFSEPVTITGSPVLNLNNGKTASLISGTGGQVLLSDFKYDIGVEAIENTSQLYITSITGGSIVDYSGNDLDRTINANNIKSNNIRIDNIKPIISLSNNGNSTYEQSQSTTMYITDTNGSGIKEVKYIWNNTSSTPSDSSFTEIGKNNLQVTIDNVTGNRYLHIKAVDVAGNVSYYNSLVFKLDNTSPSIIININGGSAAKLHTTSVDLDDDDSGTSGNFKYLWTTSTLTPTDAMFDAGSNGTEGIVIYKNTGNGNYYLHIEACDKAGNKSYKTSDVFIFDNIAPDVITVTNKDDIDNIVSSNSYQKNYNIQIFAQDTNGDYSDGDIESIKYIWSDGSQHINTSLVGWQTYTNSISYNNNQISGYKYLHIIVEDIAGNIQYNTYQYTFDYTKPAININSDYLTGVYSEISANIEVSDIHNEINTFKYIWRDNSIENIIDGTWINGTITGDTGIGNPTKNDISGNWYLHVYCEDKVGNTNYKISGPYTLDVDGPIGEINIIEETTNDGLITLNISATDNVPNNNLEYKLSQDGSNTWSDWTILQSPLIVNNYSVNDVSEGITTISVKFRDKSGNISDIYSDTIRIDITPPTANVSYSPTKSDGWTNEDVVATLVDLSDNLGETVLAPNGFEYNFISNGTYIFEIEDMLGNSTTVSAIVDWIDKIPPTIEQVSGNQTAKKEHIGVVRATDNVTNNDKLQLFYQWTKSTVKPNVEDVNWISATNGETVTKNGVDGEWYLHIKAVDEAGNEPITTSGKYIFDNTAPSGSISISPEYKFIRNNIIQLNLEVEDECSSISEIEYSLSNDEENWSEWKLFTDIIYDYNGNSNEGINNVYIKFKDKLGNISNVYSDYFTIDITPPVCELLYSSNEADGYINEDVTVSVINLGDNYSDEDNIVLNDTSYTFRSNGEYVFSLSDEVGNTTTLSAIVTWIDKTMPTIEQVSGNQTVKKEHTGVISATDNITNIENIQLYYQWTNGIVKPDVNDTNWIQGTNGETVTKNGVDGEWYLHIKAIDEAGNKPIATSGKYVFDNTAPTGSIVISPEYKFIKNNIIKLNLEVEDVYSNISDIEYSLSDDNENWSEWKEFTDIIYDYSGNNEEGINNVYIKFRDKLGNVSSVYSDSFTIDKTPPTGELLYSLTEASGYTNEDVTVSVINVSDNYSNVENILLNDTSYTFRLNGEYVFSLVDEVGNVTTLSAIVTWIDKEQPLIDITPNSDQTAKNEHSAVISASDNTTSEGGINVSYQWTDSNNTPEYDDANWIQIQNNSAVTIGVLDGDWYLHVKAEDEPGNRSVHTSGKFVLDNTGPEGSIDILEEITNTNKLTLNLSANDIVSSIGQLKYSLSLDSENWSEWATLSEIINNYEIPLIEGKREIYVKYKDELNNESDIYTDYVNIDLTPPLAEVNYSAVESDGYVNTDVLVTISNIVDNYTSTENILVSESSHVFKTNGAHVFTLTDEVGNTRTINIEINYIDKESPIIQPISGNQNPKQSHSSYIDVSDNVITKSSIDISYQWTQDSISPSIEDANWIETNNEALVTKSGINGDWYLHVKAKDEVGNYSLITSGIYSFDNEAPVGTITYSTENRTAQPVIATLSTNETVTITNTENGINKHTFKDNGEFVFEFEDLAGNTGSAISTVTWIDMNVPSANVEISTTDWTNDDVVVTASVPQSSRIEILNFDFGEILDYKLEKELSRDLVINNSQGDSDAVTTQSAVYLKSYSVGENGKIVFKIKDIDTLLEQEIEITVDNIDKEDPIYSISLSETNQTNNDIVLTISTEDNTNLPVQIIKPNNVEELNGQYIISNNGTYNFKLEDVSGNTMNLPIEITNIDKKAPELSIVYSQTDWTNQNITATVKSDEEIIVTNNSGETEHEFTDNGTFVFQVKDLAGNTASITAEVTKIDKQLPDANITYIPTEIANTDVVVTITPSEEVDIIPLKELELVENTINKYIIKENGTYQFNLIDRAGNKKTKSITITNIDKESPEISYTLSNDKMTNKNVEIFLHGNEIFEVVDVPYNIITINDVDNTRYYAEKSGEYIFGVEDRAGNEGQINVSITNIDKIPPTLSVTYSETDWTNEDVIATVIADEEANYDNGQTYTFTQNGEYKFYVTDIAGNTSKITAVVDKIDKISPNATLTYDPKDTVNTDVIITVEPDEIATIESLDELKLVTDQNNQFIATTNGEYSFKLGDRAGNEATKSININNIDKESPEITYTLSTEDKTNKEVEIYLYGNESFEVTYIPEGIRTVNDEDNVTKYFADENGEYIFTVIDQGGNEGEASINITNIDKIPPILSVTFSAIEWTNEDVLATVIADEEVIYNNECGETYIFTQNGEYEFSVTDIAGNTNKIKAVVENIDKINPNATLSYAPKNTVNTDIIITVEPNETATIESIDELQLVTDKENQFIVKSNGEYNFELVDRAGNKTIKKINISNIDKENPEITYTLSTEEKTNEAVEIYFKANEPFVVTNIPQGIRTEEENNETKYFADESGEYIFLMEDLYGNAGQYTVNILNIDLIEPELSITYSAIEWTNEDVIATVQANEDINVLNTTNNEHKYIFSQNGEFTFYVEDIAGNKASIVAKVDKIDKKAPSATFSYSNTEITKEDIQVTITGNEILQNIISLENLEVVTESAIDLSVSQIYNIETNGEYHFKITDLAGNIKDYEIYVTNIDKTPPIMTYTLIYDTPAGIKEVNQDGVIVKGPVITYGDDAQEYQDSLITNNDVLLEFNANEAYEIISIPQNVKVNDKIYIIENNGEYTFEAKDIAGNTTPVVIIVDTIEKSVPQVEIRYSETNATKNDVIATVVSINEEYIRVVNNYNKYSRVFSENGEYIFIVQDYAGNEIEITATVNNIDRTPPELSLVYSNKEYTSDSVTVELKSNEEINILNNNGSKYYIFENNGDMRFIVEDLLGNSSNIIASVNNIDKTAPVIIFTGNEKLGVLEGQEIDLLSDVTTLEYEDKNLPINIIGNVDINQPGKYTITYEITDNAGNTSTKEREVNVIAKDNLLITFNGVNINEVNYISGNHFDLNTYNTKGEYKILYYKGKLTKGQIKIKGEELTNNELNIQESGWYTFLIYDQERNTRFYNVFIIKQ